MKQNVLFDTHLAYEFPDEIERFRTLFPDVVVQIAGNDDDFLRLLPEAEVIVTGPIPQERLDLAHRLQLHIVPFAGVNRAPLGWYRDHRVRITSSHGNAEAVAERAIALMYAAAGRVVEFDQDLRRGKWHRRRDEKAPFDYWRSLTGARIAILGVGEIGSRIARLIRPLAGELIGFRRSGKGAPGTGDRRNPDDRTSEHIITAEDPDAAMSPAHHPERVFDSLRVSLEEAIAGADVVIVTIPLTTETRGLLVRDSLVATNNAILVNISRAEIVPEDDLYTALTDGTLYAAGLDVWYRYPSPFWEEGSVAMPATRSFHALQNVVLSPHAGSHSEAGKRGQLTGALAYLEEYLKAGTVSRIVDTQLGY